MEERSMHMVVRTIQGVSEGGFCKLGGGELGGVCNS